MHGQPGCLNGAPESVQAKGSLLPGLISTGLEASRPAVASLPVASDDAAVGCEELASPVAFVLDVAA